MPKPNTLLTALLPLLLLTACASPSTPSATAVVTRQVQLPPLPASARQTDSPNFLQELTIWRDEAAKRLTTPSDAD